MRNFKSLAFAIFFAIALFYVPGVTTPEASAQGRQDFLLVNKTGVEIYALYVTPHNAEEWGDDILGIDTLPNGNEVEITFSRKEKAKYWDIRIEDEDGNSIEWESLNLLEISKVTLYYKNRKPTAIVQ
ncbi:MAG TPA: hypothetical protein PKM58_01905 [Pyrinomonadaceae bacterium]|nr:hypothetical protein [Pyrinomonadaceae bacterium]